MVQLHIIPKSPQQVDEVISFLLKERHVLTAMTIKGGSLSKLDATNNVKSGSKSLITAVTRTLHFNALNTAMKARFKARMPILYSTPIIHMDGTQAEEIVAYIENF